MADGYIIQNNTGSFLSKNLSWLHTSQKKADIHPANKIEEIVAALQKTASKQVPRIWPQAIIPAKWSPETGTEIIGEPKPL